MHLKLFFRSIKALFVEGNPSPVKAAMGLAGMLKDESLRLQMVSVTNESLFKIKAAMKNFGGLL